MRQLMSGNEALARGAWEAGVRVAAAYPGTPSTELLEALAAYPGVDTGWSPNEKVALEVASGAAIAGARALAAMKHVGVNVAADPLLTLAYTGVNAGLVLVSADDPGMHSSQNEQDNRHYARFAKVPMLEPADSQEAYALVPVAFDLSEQFDTPVLLRVTTRLSHGKGIVATGERAELPLRPYAKDPAKYVMVPANARLRRQALSGRLAQLEAFAEGFTLNTVEPGGDVGVIVAGIPYQYVKEAFGSRVSVFKLTMTWPLPIEGLRRWAAGLRAVYVVEELGPLVAEELLAAGIPVRPSGLPHAGELTPAAMRAALGPEAGLERFQPARVPAAVPARPPVMCPGCPHRGVFYVLGRLECAVTGDIGCYTLGYAAPLEAMDTCVCMGASISVGAGFARAWAGQGQRPVVAVIGDSTFFHSGITGLMDAVHNGGALVTVVLDNRTTGMTGHQDNPGTGRNLKRESVPRVEIEAVAKAVGVRHVAKVDPHDLAGTEAALKAAIAHGGVAVVVAESPCALLRGGERRPPWRVLVECAACGLCAGLGCPALHREGEEAPAIDPALCAGCGTCAALCPFGAIAGGEV